MRIAPAACFVAAWLPAAGGATQRPVGARLLLALLAAALVAGLPAAARAASICTAAELCAPASASCTIAGQHDVAAQCVLDFGSRPVVITGSLRADTSGGGYTIDAGSLTLSGGQLDATGSGTDFGGDIVVVVGGTFRIEGGAGVDVDGPAGLGTLDVTAGSIEIVSGAPAISANGTDPDGGGGTVTLTASGMLQVDAPIVATGGNGGSDLGTVVLSGANVEISRTIDASGGSANSPEGVAVTADPGTIQVRSGGVLDARSQSYLSDGSRVGGTGGEITLDGAGGVTIDGTLRADGPAPDGTGGTITITSSAGAIAVDGTVTAEGAGDDSVGGAVSLDAATGIGIAGDLRASGGKNVAGQGSTIDLSAADDITIGLQASLEARNGGGISTLSKGGLTVLGTLDVSATAAAVDGGVNDLGPHCRLTVNGTLDVRAGAGGIAGDNLLTGGTIDVQGAARLYGTPCTVTLPFTTSCNTMTLPSGTPTIAPTALIDPPPFFRTDPETHPCCGNGTVDPGEECDDRNSLHCDGCSPQCTIEAAGFCLDDGNPCTGTTCVPTEGCELLSGTPCPDDGDPCTDDVCSYGVCTHPSPCRDPSTNPCRVGHCDPVLGCFFDTLQDGIECARTDCSVSTCRGGECISSCDDGNPCTNESYCWDATTCLHSENFSSCSPCTVGGVPRPAGTPCADGNPCTTFDTCDGAGTCVGGSKPSVAEQDPCVQTVNAFGLLCSQFESRDLCPSDCSGLSDGTPCLDGNLCAKGECRSGVCTGTPISCDSVCGGGGGACQDIIGCPPVPPSGACTDDGNPCTEERCDPVLGCVHEPLSGVACLDDGNRCTRDECVAGACAHPAATCDDGVDCTIDACDPSAGCVFTPDDSRCDDGDPCTIDRCSPANGCTFSGSCPPVTSTSTTTSSTIATSTTTLPPATSTTTTTATTAPPTTTTLVTILPVAACPDARAAAAVRAEIDARCNCLGAADHGAYVRCAVQVAKAHSLPKRCKQAVKACAARSTCGRPGFVACCRTGAKGATKCSIKRAAACKAPKKGSACVGSHPSCCEACSATGCAP